MDERRFTAERLMETWLAHPAELGHRPWKIECAGEFEEEGTVYYIFKFKSRMLSPWLLGVCGGMEETPDGSPGYVGSEFGAFDPAAAESDGRALAAKMRQIRQNRLLYMERLPVPGAFEGSVLLSEPAWEPQKFVADLREHGLELTATYHNAKSPSPSLTLETEGLTAHIEHIPSPLSPEDMDAVDKSAVLGAEEVPEAVRAHRGRVSVRVEPCGDSPKARGALFILASISLVSTHKGLGLYTGGAFLSPVLLDAGVEMLDRGHFPVPALIHTRMRKDGGGITVCTSGLVNFGRWELEVVNSGEPTDEVVSILLNAAAYVIEEDAVLLPGETLGFSASQKLPLTLSPGVLSEGETLKIGF